ncbi:MAG: recombinase family protein, partial [Oscillibacter sp.]|nr:recombinase family protein [Oscillibacter sp.]
SRDDENAGDSNSIVNQKRMLEDYAAQHGFDNPVHFTDDGWSGGNFNRPAWKQLAAEVEAGHVSTVIAKDMSRIGRAYLQTGWYTEVFFRENGVRFIAIANGVDSADQNTQEFAPFLNIMSEWYLRDCSRKITAAKQIQGNAGQHLTSHALYGYRKDPEDKNHWLVDEDAAAVVRRIFRMSIEGHGPYQIAKILMREHVERPSCYLGKRGMGNRSRTWDESRQYDWVGSEVEKILEKPEYMGHTVNFRTYKESYKDKNHKVHDPKDWKIFENTHEAIVDPETWQMAQRARKTRRRTDSTGVANPLTGLLYCADCGAKLYNHRCVARQIKEGRQPDPDTGLSPYDYYECSAYNLSLRHEHRVCSAHRITTRVIRAILLDTIRLTADYALSNEAEFIEKVREASKVKQEQTAKELKRKLTRDRRRFAEMDGIIKKLYESYATGKITEKRFEALIADYEREQTELEEAIASGQAELDAFNEDTLRADKFLELARKYTDFTELTTPMLLEFVDKVLVHKAEYHGIERTMVVDVYLRFIGNFDVPEPPAPELTPEELAEQERIREKREKSRLRHLRYRQRKRQEKLEAQQKALAEMKGESETT